MSGIIKAGAPAAERSSVGVVAFNFDDMTGKARAYLAQVKAEAAEILAKAQQDAAQIRQEAQQQGARAASETAEKSVQQRVEQQVRQQMQSALPALEQLVQQLTIARLEWLQQWERNAVQLALAVARKIIRRELSQHPEITTELLREALELAAGSQSIKVYLSPHDHAALGKQISALAQQLARLSPTDIVPHENVTPGGCVVQTEFGTIDQQVEAQLARVAEELY